MMIAKLFVVKNNDHKLVHISRMLSILAEDLIDLMNMKLDGVHLLHNSFWNATSSKEDKIWFT